MFDLSQPKLRRQYPSAYQIALLHRANIRLYQQSFAGALLSDGSAPLLAVSSPARSGRSIAGRQSRDPAWRLVFRVVLGAFRPPAAPTALRCIGFRMASLGSQTKPTGAVVRGVPTHSRMRVMSGPRPRRPHPELAIISRASSASTPSDMSCCEPMPCATSRLCMRSMYSRAVPDGKRFASLRRASDGPSAA